MLAAYKNVFARLQGAFFVVDGQGTILLWSAAAAETLGYSGAQATGKGCHDLLRGRDLGGNPYGVPDCPVLKTCRRGVAIRPHEVWLTRSDGTEALFSCSVCVLTTPPPGSNFVVYHLHEGGLIGRSLSPAGAVPLASPVTSPEEPVARRRLDGAAGRIPSTQTELTPREVEILAYLAKGRHAASIATELSIAYATVRNHIASILRKLGVHSQLEAVALAYKLNLT